MSNPANTIEGSPQATTTVETPSNEVVTSHDHGAAPIMRTWSAEDHRRRLLNIQTCERGIRKCLKKHLITNYLPGQVSYNMGEYPSRAPYDPDEYDDNELAELASNGIRCLQVMEDWNDLLNLHGADRFSSPNPAGMRRFIDMAHSHGIKVLLYASTGFMQDGDPDFDPSWSREPRGSVVGGHWNLIRCSPASPAWRSFVLQKTVQILEEYDIDGLYNDGGYIATATNPNPAAADEVEAFNETAEHWAAKEDLVALVHSEVKRRGGIYKLHIDCNLRPAFNQHLYDYLWVGEGVGSLERMRLETKEHPPYVVPQFDRSHGDFENEDHEFLHTIPYMQFPQLLAGRPFTGERGNMPGVKYFSPIEEPLRQKWIADFEYFHQHPEGPFIYGPWDKYPARPGVRETHAKWLKRYLPMVEEGSYAYLEITDSDLFAVPLPENAVASVFVNLETYLVLANYDKSAVEIQTVANYVAVDTVDGRSGRVWDLAAESFLILLKVD